MGKGMAMSALRPLPILLSVAVFGCGSSEPPPVMNTSCGTAGTKAGMECSSIEDCGAAGRNAQTVSFCEHCFAHPDTHVCEAGVCRMIPTDFTELGTIKFGFSLLGMGSGAQSFAAAAVLPIAADGSKLSCAKLLSTCNYTNNFTLNASSYSRQISGGGDTIQDLVNVDPGPDRLLFLALTSDRQGKGRVLAKSCSENILVEKGKTITVTMELVAP